MTKYVGPSEDQQGFKVEVVPGTENMDSTDSDEMWIYMGEDGSQAYIVLDGKLVNKSSFEDEEEEDEEDDEEE